MIDLFVEDETAPLKSVILGSPLSFGGTPSLSEAYDPKSKFHISNGTFPKEEDITPEMKAFRVALEKHGVEVLSPKHVEDTNQVFARDIAFVIENKLIVAGILDKRKRELEGLDEIITSIRGDKIFRASGEVRVEGGDVMPWKDKVFVGYSKEPDFRQYEVARTNEAGVNFIKGLFPEKQVHSFELNKSDTDPYENALHLDCCFQPIGDNQAIIHKNGFKNKHDYDFLMDYFGSENVIEIDKIEMYNMFSNVFSISPEVIVTELSFHRLNKELEDRGFKLEKIKYSEVSKMEGLFRCSTLPLERERRM